MATDYCNINATGKLIRDEEVKQTTGGKNYLKFTIVSTAGYFDNNHTWVSQDEFTDCTLWGEAAKKMTGKMKKFDKVFVSGQKKTEKWDDRQTGEKKQKVGCNVQKLINFTADERDHQNRTSGGGAPPPPSKPPMPTGYPEGHVQWQKNKWIVWSGTAWVDAPATSSAPPPPPNYAHEDDVPF